MPKKQSRKKLNLQDVYNAGEDTEAARLMRRRGGGGGVEGRNYDQQEFKTDEIDEDNDEEITEDDAFDDEDEDRFGLFFSKTKGRDGKKKTEVDEESERDEEEEAEDGDFVDLSEMLGGESVSQKISFLIPESDSDGIEGSDSEELDASEIEDSSDSEEDQDMGDSSQDDEPEDLAPLLDLINPPKEKKRKRISERTEPSKESEFMPKPTARKKVAMGDLVNAVADESGFTDIKRQLSALEKHDSKPVSVPLAPRLQDRLHRQAAKEQTDKSVSQWVPIVKRNREADTLSFPMNEPTPNNLSSGALVGKFEPFTEMEKEIEAVLELSGMSEKKQKEMEELELNKLSKEEMMERRSELAKMRSLMFFKEQKQKKIAKIKSKTYRKISKKAAEKGSLEDLQELDPDRAREEQDRLEFERAKERMTLKHKNTGKWAKKMLGRTDEPGSETHKALMEQLERGEQLRRKIVGVDSGSDSESDGGDARESAIEKLSKLDGEIDGVAVESKGVFGMKFMQKGLERQKLEAKREILELQKELGGAETEEEVKPSGRKVFERRRAAVDDNVVSDGDSDTGEFHARASGPVQVSRALFKVESFDMVEGLENEPFSGNPNTEPVVATPKRKAVAAPVKKVEVVASPVKTIPTSSVKVSNANPWLSEEVAVVKKSIVTFKQFEKSSKAVASIGRLSKEKKKMLDGSGIDTVDSDSGPLLRKVAAEQETNDSEKHDLVHSSNLEDYSNADIMRMAFANDNIAADFAKEKAELAEIETGKTEESDMPGWGAWSGPGITTKPKVKVIVKAGGVDVEKRKDFNLKHVIINEKRQKKAVKYMQPRLPHGFENREQYERTIMTPLGKEWNTQSAHKKLVQPRVTTKLGHVIAPLKMTSK